MPDPTSDLIINLRHRSAWAVICLEFLSTHPTPEADHFLRQLQEEEQAAVELLARALRTAGRPPGLLGPDEDLIADARRRRDQSTRLQFITVGLERSLSWYQEHLADAASPHRQLWQTLHDHQLPHLAEVKRLLGIPNNQ
jgi:hypothetical protein